MLIDNQSIVCSHVNQLKENVPCPLAGFVTNMEGASPLVGQIYPSHKILVVSHAVGEFKIIHFPTSTFALHWHITSCLVDKKWQGLLFYHVVTSSFPCFGTCIHL